MNSVTLQNVGKKFNRDWIFKNLNLLLSEGDVLAITGSNGSGKSTLLQILCGYLAPSEGKLEWSFGKKNIEPEKIYQFCSISSPSLQLVEDFTMMELLQFYFTFKKVKGLLSPIELMALSGLQDHSHKMIKDFSSGMKQRLKLLLAFAADTSLLLLDEPCSNLDRKAIDWYQSTFRIFSPQRIIVICSNNIEDELFMCNKSISMENFKN